MKEEYRYIGSEEESMLDYMYRIRESSGYIVPILNKEIKLKYSRTYLGALWTGLPPFFNITLYVVFFGFVFGMVHSEENYILYVISGYACWNIISQSSTQTGSALLHNQELLKKLAIPKAIYPISKSLLVWLESVVLFVLMILIAFFQNKTNVQSFAFFLPAILLLYLFTLSLGMLIASLSIYRRDVLQALPILLQVMVWFTPVFYPVSILPSFLKPLVLYNPFTSFIELIRWTVGIYPTFPVENFVGLGVSILIIVISFVLFKRKENSIINYF